jgi:hypothetical protein
MNKIKYLFLFLVISFLSPVLNGQVNPHELLIAPWNGSNYLNDVIVGDSTATGARVDPDRIYVLQRNGVYFVNTPIRNTGWVLNIKAQDGTGRKPVIFLVKNTTTSANPAAFLQVAGNIWLSNLIISGILESDTSSYSLMQGQLIGTNQAGKDIVIDGCILTNSNGNHIRTDQATRVMKITNTIFANMGYLGRSNLGAGKAIDVRAVSCDSLVLVNNTFVNFQDRIIRHFNSTAAINNFIFDHNTVVNGMSYHGTLVLGILGAKSEITNNLFIDPFALGNDTDYVRQAEFNESGELDPIGNRRMSWIFSVNNTETNWKVSNNFYSISDSGQAFFNRHASTGVTGEGSPLSRHINSRLGADSLTAFVKQSVVLANIPKLMTAMMDWYRRPVEQGGAGKTKATTNFNRLLHDYNRASWTYLSDTLNGSYSTSSPAYSAGTGSFPLGDLNWFPTKKQEWLNWITDVNEPGMTPVEFSLNQNYPNPFNPSTKISFNLVAAGKTNLSVFNLLGQKMATLIDEELTAGYHEINFDASKLTTGVYFYRLESGNNFSIKKMLLVK